MLRPENLARSSRNPSGNASGRLAKAIPTAGLNIVFSALHASASAAPPPARQKPRLGCRRPPPRTRIRRAATGRIKPRARMSALQLAHDQLTVAIDIGADLQHGRFA